MGKRMKQEMKSWGHSDIRHILLLGALWLLFAASAAMAATSATVTIKGKVSATCSVSMPAIIAFDDMKTSDFDGKQSGEVLNQYRRPLNIEAKCDGGAAYKLKFKASDNTTYGNCVDPEPGGRVTFCVDDQDGKRVAFDKKNQAEREYDKSATHSFSVVPAKGRNPTIPGTYTGSVTVNIEPK